MSVLLGSLLPAGREPSRLDGAGGAGGSGGDGDGPHGGSPGGAGGLGAWGPAHSSPDFAIR